MEKPNFEIDYQGGISAIVDWVAGGNFDGYVYKTTLRFVEKNNQVIMKTKILDKSRYDEEIIDSETKGQFEITDNKTITCIFGETKMRGKILGKRKEFIAFSITHPRIKYPISECYEMKGN